MKVFFNVFIFVHPLLSHASVDLHLQHLGLEWKCYRSLGGHLGRGLAKMRRAPSNLWSLMVSIERDGHFIFILFYHFCFIVSYIVVLQVVTSKGMTTRVCYQHVQCILHLPFSLRFYTSASHLFKILRLLLCNAYADKVLIILFLTDKKWLYYKTFFYELNASIVVEIFNNHVEDVTFFRISFKLSNCFFL